VQLIAENLTLSRASRVIVADLSFRLQAGDALVLTGRNGSGKTTLLRALAGFLSPTSGAIRVDGGAEEREPGECAHFVGHLDGLKAHLTVGENLTFWSKYLGDASSERRIVAALERFALVPLTDIPAGYLSAGQRRRLALARIVAAPRPIWLLDEPTVSLDTASIALLQEAIEAHLAGGGLAVIATHVAMGLADAKELRLGKVEAAA
jgi:heme exporter protein A